VSFLSLVSAAGAALPHYRDDSFSDLVDVVVGAAPAAVDVHDVKDDVQYL
jgi:hypothetical protein